MSVTSLSVVICAHDPRPDHLKRVLEALRSQTLPAHAWELLLIDNASAEPLERHYDLTWHGRARHLLEPKLGLSVARLRGIAEASGSMLVFVDADNVLRPDYLAVAGQIAGERPYLGAWGGRILGEFEIEPPAWSRPHLRMLALREFDRDCWGNSIEHFDAAPSGAGLCVRSGVAREWAQRLGSDPRRAGLGRKGAGLGAAEDSDLVFTACDLGFGTGIFTGLCLTHLIPKERLDLAYFERLAEGMERSHIVLRSLRHVSEERHRASRATRLYEWYRRRHMNQAEQRLQAAIDRGRDLGWRDIGR